MLRAALAAAGAATAATLAAPAHADGAARTPLLPAYVQECGACHVAFPPGLLPAASWQRLMGGLQRHYGSDASLDAGAAREIGAWLQANAATGKRDRGAPPEDRITRSAWFQHEHDEVAAGTWARASIGKPSNCAACHPKAEQGRYTERDIRIPK
jgi:hypothetical protein